MLSIIALGLFAAASVQAGSDELHFSHRPPAEVASGSPLLIAVSVENGWRLGALELHWRRANQEWNTVKLGKAENGGYAAIVGPTEVRPPSIEYYLSSREPGQAEVNRFASAQVPHPVVVHASDDEQTREDRLVRYRSHSSRASFSGEYAGFGGHGAYDAGNGVRHPYRDQYYQVQADYSYRLFTVLQAIKLGVVRVRGEVPPPLAFDSSTTVFNENTRRTGIDYGFGELAFNLVDRLGFTARLILGADDLGFATGAGGTLRIGADTGTHAELGGQIIQRYGFDTFLRLAWDTVPRWPIGFSIHLTNAPNAPVGLGATPDHPLTDGGAPVGIRALLDAGFEATQHVTLLMKVGYQARFSTDGGPTLGGGVVVEW